jgi:hypothetical protein
MGAGMMVKTAEVYGAIVDLLITDSHEWTVKALYEHLVIHTFGIDVAEYTVRRAVAMLPTACITRKGNRIVVEGRYFAPTAELVAVIKSLDDGMHIPLMLNDRRRIELRRSLVLTTDYALHKSLEWARDGGAVEYASGYGSLFVRAC